MSYPTYLFIKPDGSLFSRSGGFMVADKFISVAKSAIEDLKDPKPLAVWENEYTKKRNDPNFLLEYMDKRTRLGKPNTELFDEYLALLPIEQRVSDKIIEIYYKESHNFDITTLAFINLIENKHLFYPKVGGYVYNFMIGAIDNSFRKACKNKDEQFLQRVIEANDKLPTTQFSKTKEELYMNYFMKTNDIVKYVSNAIIYCEKSLMSVSTDSIINMDKKLLQNFDENQLKILKTNYDSVQIEGVRNRMAHAMRDRYGEALNNIAWDFSQKVSDLKALEQALDWSIRSLDIYPNNHMYIDTYANLLYKLGRKDEAIELESEAIRIATETKVDIKFYEKTLVKMKAGEKTWKN